MSGSKRCKTCGNPVDLEVAQSHDGACPWCLAAFTLGPEAVGNPETASQDPSKQFGKYVRTEKLGAGGMGEVWKALDTELNRWVALKFLKDEDPSVVARFQREARTAAALSHSGIAAIHEVGEVEGRHFIAMQYVQGRTLAHFPRNDRRLIVRLFRDAARALDHAHRHGIIHRDLKPENLMVEEREEGWSLVVLDFGLARPIEGGEKLSQSGEVYGTAHYMSPEQARGDHLDERADVYSLGATMYDVLTGKTPFEGPNLLEVIRKVGLEEPVRPRKHNPRIHRDLETIILKCLEKDRDRRYANARELAEDLERFLNSDPILARPPSTLYRLKMTLGKRRAQVVAVAALLGLIGTAAIFIPKWRSEASARAKEETAGREKKERYERARPHLEAGRKVIQRMKARMRSDYKPEDLRSMSAHARAEFGRALAQSPDLPEAHLETGIAHALAGDEEKALESYGRAIAADADFTPAYLERVRLQIDDYERERHGRRGGVNPETPESKAVLARLEADLGRVERFSKEHPQQVYAQALLAFARGDYKQAAEELARYLETEPEDAPAHYWRGHALLHLDRRPEALEALNRAVACHAREAYAVLLRGVVKHDLGDKAGALADYSLVIEQNMRARMVVTGYFNRGNLKREMGDSKGAIADFDRAIELKMDSTDPHFNRAGALQDLGDHRGAIAGYTKVLALDPKDAEAHVGIGTSKWLMNQNDEAIADYTRAIDVNPNLAIAWGNRGVSKAALGRYEEAIADYTKAIDLDPKAPGPVTNRGLALTSLGRHAEAIADHTRAINLDPKSVVVFNNRGKARAAAGRFEEAVADHAKAVELDAKSWEGYLNRGLAKASLGRFDEAIEDYTKAVGLDSKRAAGYVNRGRAKEAKGLLEEAIDDYTKSIDLEPGNSDNYNNRGIGLEKKRQFDEAIADYTRAIELKPKDPIPYANRGSAKEGKGQFDEAIADFKKALDLAPQDWPHREFTLGRLRGLEVGRPFQEANRLFEAKKYREAIAHYKRIVDSRPTTKEGIGSAYNIACGHALLGEKKEALDWLEKSVHLGWSDVSFLEDDADLESLRGEERYRKLVEKLKSE